MRSILKSCSKFLPLFLGVVSIFLLVLALVPGRLEYASHGIWFVLVLGLRVPEWLFIGINVAGILTLIFLTVYDLRKILYSRKNNLNSPPIPGLNSLFIVTCTWLLIQIHLPARLLFYTSSDSFEQALVQQQALKWGNYQNIKKIGNYEISETVIGDSYPSRSISFVTTSDTVNGKRGRFSPYDYGFIYRADDRGADWMDNTHIYGKWYIFCKNTGIGG
jgi:hypothetical protein